MAMSRLQSVALISVHGSPLGEPAHEPVPGQAVQLAGLAGALGAAGHAVTVYARRSRADQPDEALLGPGVTVRHLDAGPPRPAGPAEMLRWMPQLAERLAACWTELPPDVAHAHDWLAGVAAQLAARRVDVPVVQTLRTVPIDRSPTSEEQRVHFAVARDAARVITTGRSAAALLAQAGTDRRRIHVVPPGVDTSLFTEVGAPWPGPQRRAKHRLVAVRGATDAGGAEVAMAALRALPDAELLLVGGPPPAWAGHGDPVGERLAGFAAQLGLAERVRLLGPVPHAELPGLLRSADVVVAAPRRAVTGQVAVEATACRRPVVASAVGGLTDGLADGVTGVLVPPGRADLLGRALRALFADPFRAEALGEAGIDRARARFGWARIAAETARVYDSVLAAGTDADAPADTDADVGVDADVAESTETDRDADVSVPLA